MTTSHIGAQRLSKVIHHLNALHCTRAAHEAQEEDAQHGGVVGACCIVLRAGKHASEQSSSATRTPRITMPPDCRLLDTPPLCGSEPLSAIAERRTSPPRSREPQLRAFTATRGCARLFDRWSIVQGLPALLGSCALGPVEPVSPAASPCARGCIRRKKGLRSAGAVTSPAHGSESRLHRLSVLHCCVAQRR